MSTPDPAPENVQSLDLATSNELTDSGAELPTGTLTFVMTDVEGSTPLWDRAPDAMRAAMLRHDDIIDRVTLSHDGYNHKARGEGDSRFLVFTDAAAAVGAAAEIQRRLTAEVWSLPEPVKVRIGVHTGSVDLRDGDYFGTNVNRAARVRGLAHGGQVVLSAATSELVADALPVGTSLRALGEHPLKGLARPEVIHQLVIEGLRSEFAPLASDAGRMDLPVQTTSLIGRDDDVSMVVALLEEHRLVTIHAAGGTGKTRVGVEAATRLAPRFSNGTHFVGLAPLSDPDAVPAAIADAVGVPLVGTESEADQVLGYLRKKRKLLLLDNFEHVRPAASFVARVLEEAPGVFLLVTSRERLDISGETAFPLQGLSWDSEDRTSEALELFVDAARRRLPGWELADGDRSAIARILAATQGMPLGVILAAAWVDVLSVADIADEIDSSVDFLETEAVDVPDRHRSVRAMFDYSWRLLDDTDRDKFARLSVFRGGFTRQAARAVAGASVRDLARMVGKSLLVSDPDAGRYSVHELLRQLGEEQLVESGQSDPTRDAHAEYMSALASALAERWRNGDQVECLADFAADVENFRAAWAFAVERRLDLMTRDVLQNFFFYHDCRGDLRRALEHFGETADELEGRDGDRARLVAALCRTFQGWFTGLLGDPDAATDLYAAMRPIVDAIGDSEDLAMTVGLGTMWSLQTRGAEQVLADTEAFLAGDVDPDTQYWARQVEDWIAYQLAVAGDIERARQELDHSMQRALRSGDLFHRIWLHEAASFIAQTVDDLDTARRQIEIMLTIASDLGHARASGYAVGNLGIIAERQGDLPGAEEYYLRSLAFADELGQVPEVLCSLCDLARLRLAAGESAEALRIVASVRADPQGAHGRRFSPESAHDLADQVVAAVADTMSIADIDAQLEISPADSVEVVVKSLLTGADPGPRV